MTDITVSADLSQGYPYLVTSYSVGSDNISIDGLSEFQGYEGDTYSLDLTSGSGSIEDTAQGGGFSSENGGDYQSSNAFTFQDGGFLLLFSTVAIDTSIVDSASPIVLGNSNSFATCFVEGTQITTVTGELRVEHLRIGDHVLTLHGKPKPIRWIGRRSYAGSFISGNHLMLPVCIKAGAIDRDIPRQDLWVSPGHGVFIDGVLVPAWRLVNGSTIIQSNEVAQVTYLHIELDEHDIILAEGMPAESFIDENCRGQFGNCSEYYDIYPNSLGCRMTHCAPRVEEGFQLQAIQRHLAERAGIVHTALTPGPLRGFVDVAGDGRVCGWAQDRHAPESAVCLDIVVGGRRVIRVLANRFRRDLRKAGFGTGCHAFDVTLPPGLSGDIEVRRSCDHEVIVRTTAAKLSAAA